MNTPLKNPCLECNHHLFGGDKNCDLCRDCDKRVAYVAAIGKCPSSTMSEHVDLEGNAGSNLSKIAIDDLHGPKSKDDLAEHESPVENLIKKVCESENMTVAELRAGIKGVVDPVKREWFQNTRDHIIKYLASGKFGNFNQAQIGKLLNISNHTVCMRMKVIGISPGKPDNLKSTKKKKHKMPPPQKKASENQPPKTLVLNFKKHPELYEQIEKLAERELRQSENQVLYILLKIHERGLDMEKLDQKPQA